MLEISRPVTEPATVNRDRTNERGVLHQRFHHETTIYGPFHLLSQIQTVVQRKQWNRQVRFACVFITDVLEEMASEPAEGVSGVEEEVETLEVVAFFDKIPNFIFKFLLLLFFG